uniref:Uncharacterized protein n=1 Tax=Anguilla anguilla TaxID=7936 RepID=A0A0E9WLV8_ANGAN
MIYEGLKRQLRRGVHRELSSTGGVLHRSHRQGHRHYSHIPPADCAVHSQIWPAQAAHRKISYLEQPEECDVPAAQQSQEKWHSGIVQGSGS